MEVFINNSTVNSLFEKHYTLDIEKGAGQNVFPFTFHHAHCLELNGVVSKLQCNMILSGNLCIVARAFSKPIALRF